MSTVSLRPYQREAIDEIRSEIRSGKRRILLCLPTGAGKTLTASSMILSALKRGKRCLFVAHRKELIDQTVTSFARLGVTSVGVIRAGDKRRDPSQPIQVASIQTLARRTQTDFDFVVIDEAHRACSKSYVEHLFERHARAVITGLTATAIRTDGKPLRSQFDALVIGARYSTLLAEGHLSEPMVYGTPVLPDMSTVRTSGGDYNQEDLEAAVNKGSLIGDLVTQWSKHPRRRTVAFAVSVAHSLAIVESFRAAGVRAEHLDGTTPEGERTAILARLASGETELVSNVGVLCEGWDLPACKTLILARPTKSLGLYMQMAGRILRPWIDPETGELVTPLILDHGGNVDRHGLPHEDREWSLDAKPKKVGEIPMKACKTCFAYVAAGVKVCPHCGAEFPAPAAGDAPTSKAEPIPVDLALRTLDGDDAKLTFFRQLHKQCRDRGWKFGAAIHRYEAHFGEPPPPAWISALKSDWRSDSEWKERVKDKQAAKRAEEEQAA